jgi:hypothetical protein
MIFILQAWRCSKLEVNGTVILPPTLVFPAFANNLKCLNLVKFAILQLLRLIYMSDFLLRFSSPQGYSVTWGQCYKTYYGRELQIFVIS